MLVRVYNHYDNDDSNYSDDSKHDDHDRGEFYSFYNSDDVFVNAQTFNNEDEPIEVDAKQVYARRVGEGPAIEEVNIEKKVKKQHNIKLRDIQNAVHEKYTLNISVGKTSRARDKAREYVDGAYTQQYNQLWEYCEELRRVSPGSTILMKVHTFHDGDLAAEGFGFWGALF